MEESGPNEGNGSHDELGDLRSFLEGKGPKARRIKPRDFDGLHKNDTITFRINPESIRCVTYLLFWVMCGVAILLTKFHTAGVLLAGPEDGSTCAPFDLTEFPGTEPVDRTNGFDVFTESHLRQIIGYNNICMYFDYTPSRETTAALYAYVEYALVSYVVLDFLLSAISYKKGYVSARFWKVEKIWFPINLIFCSMFRMIFVILSYKNPGGHAFGFVLLQLALISVCIKNMYYIFETNVTYSFLGGSTRVVVIIYVTIFTIISILSIYGHMHILGETFPSFYKRNFLWGTLGGVIDNTWMFFVACVPLLISFLRSRNEPALILTVDMEEPNFSS